MRNAPSELNQGHRGIAGRAAPSVRPGIHHGAGGAEPVTSDGTDRGGLSQAAQKHERELRA